MKHRCSSFLFLLMVVALMAGNGCRERSAGSSGSKGKGEAMGPAATSGPAAAGRLKVDPPRWIGPTVTGLKATGPEPTFSWTRVPGASLYSVMTRGSSGDRWMWVGTETSVRYGVMDGDLAPSVAGLAVRPSRSIKKVKPGTTYQLTVTALDGKGKLLAMSGTATYTP